MTHYIIIYLFGLLSGFLIGGFVRYCLECWMPESGLPRNINVHVRMPPVKLPRKPPPPPSPPPKRKIKHNF